MIAFRCYKLNVPDRSKDSRDCCITMGNIKMFGSSYSTLQTSARYANHSPSIYSYLYYKYNDPNIPFTPTEEMYENLNIYIGKNITDYSGMFLNCENFNRYVDTSNATNLYATFRGTNYNQPISINQNCTNCAETFMGCYSFNQSVDITVNNANCSRMFSACTNLNKAVTIRGATNVSGILYSCYKFNSPIKLLDLRTDDNVSGSIGQLIANLNNFNSSIELFGHITNLSGLLTNGFKFNSTINITSDSPCVIRGMFTNCRNFNQPVHFPNIANSISPSLSASAVSLVEIFNNCHKFNSPITFAQGQYQSGETVNFLYNYLFNNCGNLNLPVFNNKAVNQIQLIYGPNINSMRGMFNGCSNYNQITILPFSGVPCDCSSMFNYCTNLNADVSFPNSVNNLSYAMYGVNQFYNADVYIPGAYRVINVKRMFVALTYGRNIRLHFNHVLNNQFNKTDANSLIGQTITWTTMQGGFYNSQYNIYCYNNYTI